MRKEQILWLLGLNCLVAFGAIKQGIVAAKTAAQETDNVDERGTYSNDAKAGLQPAHALWKRYDPNSAKYAFRAGTVKEARRWQMRVRRAYDFSMEKLSR